MMSATAMRSTPIPASIEVAPKQALESADLPGLFPQGTRTYLTDVGVDPVKSFIAATKRVSDLGYKPVPHIPARRIRSREELETRIRAYAEEAGVTDILVIGGGLDKAAGPFTSSMEVLESGLFDRYGITEIGVAGHPEGSPDFSLTTAESALRLKRDFAERTGARMRIVTQFGFDAEMFIQWSMAVRESGVGLPIHLGVAGPAKITTLIKYAALCGVGNSVAFLKKRALALTALATTHSPEAVVGPIERHWQEAGAETSVRQIHVFPFGGLKKSAEWLYERGSWNAGTVGLDAEPLRLQA
ncbi:methylenetetrahydrofolate reductase [Mangrovicella endophytica]|uniref:methylenetetrahydrofolate reductase n=1 Tax=Mangrovicella endophytica TaxID=2066697 RepID=UPI000C9DA94F|nr:methylenetetrahydrofolate reductase [Mangrovicella endophytica]